MQFRVVLLVIAVVVMLSTVSDVAQADGDANSGYKRDVHPVLARHCFACHGSEKQEADLRLDNLDTDLLNSASAETWHDVLNKLNLGEMPPKDAMQPNEKERQIIVGWITAELERTAEARRSTGGRVVLRRLNRYEYNNTMRDLLGIDLDFAKDLPPEPSSKEGFQNNGAALGMSPLQIESYLQAARIALGKAIVTGPKPKVFEHHAETSEATRRKKEITSNRLAPGTRFLVRLNEYPTEGEILVRVMAGAIVPEGAGLPRMRVTIGVRSDTLAPEKTLGEADVIASVDDPQVLEFRGRIEEFPLPGHNPKFPGVLVTVWNDYEGTNTAPKKNKKDKKSVEDPTQPVIIVKSLDFVGPVLEGWPPPSHTNILFASDSEANESVYVREVLSRFVERAFRRPASADEVEYFASFFNKLSPQGASFEEAIRETLAMVLISPDFLYLVEPKDNDAKSQPLNDFELASRLSYFLWSSMPDDELLSVAKSGKLREPKTLDRQVRRILADPKSWNFVEHFANQWLNLSGLERIAVNPEYYPDFDDRLKSDMRMETQYFLAELLYKDLSALNLIDSDFTMLNRPLAQHYGIPGPKGREFEKVALEPAHHRGGLLAQGSILLINSTGEDSHPIKRGVWLLDRLLGSPPPPPPPDVPELNQEEPDLAALSLKRQLEVHRTKPACANCHRGIDPWGIPFESFDAVGKWRTQVERVVNKRRSKAEVETTATLPSGQEVSGLDDLKAYLLKNERDRFARSVTEKMLAYSLGRSIEFDDKQSLDRLTNQFKDSDYRLGSLISAIVQSKTFQTK